MPEIKTYPDNPAVAGAFAKYLCDWINASAGESINVSLSGGSTPKLLFEVLAADFATAVNWKRVHFFWGDERCVPPEDPESNFGQCKQLLLDKIDIPAANIHRVRGEDPVGSEAQRYQQEIIGQVPANSDGTPEFDLIILGMGGDGHTASIFPHEIELLQSTDLCAPATHPETGQRRVTLTGRVLNAAKSVVFLITGAGKAEVLAGVVDGSATEFPATHIRPAGSLTFFLDESAAANLK